MMKRGGIPRPGVAGPSRAPPPAQAQPRREMNIPAMSVTHRPRQEKAFEDIEKMKKRIIRRNLPQGEDLKKLKEIIKSIKNRDVTVQEFVGMVGPYTGDTGAALRAVMADDLASFRKMTRRVYETIAQDVSDVLGNEHVQMTQFHQERTAHFSDKMMAAIDEIYDVCPNFDFDAYNLQRNAYLDRTFPLSADIDRDPEDIELQRRQEAYHRLHWLRSEGDRLREENVKLQGRLTELKRLQQEEQQAAVVAEQQAEETKAHLEAAQVAVQEELEDLDKSIEQTMIQHETIVRKKTMEGAPRVVRKTTQVQRRMATAGPSRSQQEWGAEAAADIETGVAQQNLQEAMTRASSAVEKSKRAPKKSRTKLRRPPPVPREEAFHFSPIKTPPPPQPRETSPFHYSPPKATPPRVQRPVSQPSPEKRPQQDVTTVTQTTEVTERRPAGRRSQAPRDTWGGYY